MPEGMSFEEAAALPVVYVTAYHLLFRVTQLRPSMRVLIHMAAGGVGLAAIQLCRTVPDVVVSEPRRRRNTNFSQAGVRPHHRLSLDRLRDRGQTNHQRCRRRPRPHPLGGSDWKKGYDLLGAAGMLIAYGFANVSDGETRNLFHVAKGFLGMPRFSPISLMNQNRAVAGVNMGHLWNEVDAHRRNRCPPAALSRRQD